MISAKKTYSQTRPMPCRFCGKVIRVDMYRHVARLHLDLIQLWRCPIAWCTTWKGSPQDCLEHVRSGHDAPRVSKIAVPAIPPVGTADPFGRGEGFDMELVKVMCDVSVLPSLVSPIQEVEELSPTDASNYAAPAVPELDIIIESPEYTVPGELGCSWIPEFAPVSEGFRTEEGSFLQSLQEPLRQRPWNQPSPRRLQMSSHRLCR